MFKRFLLFSLLLVATTSSYAAEKLLLSFKLTQDESLLEAGKVIVGQKSHTWNKGVKRSYLKLSCQTGKAGTMVKTYNTADLFAGLQLTHRLAGSSVELSVTYTTVRPRLEEIRALSRSECKDMAPIVNTWTQAYSLPARNGVVEPRAFGDSKRLAITIDSIGEIR